MPTPTDRRAPSISREMLDSIIKNPVLLPTEKVYVINRAVGEYSAFAVLDHLRAIEESQRHVAREEPGEPWSVIDDRTRSRYHDLIRVLDAVSKGEEEFAEFMTWNWITVRAMDSLREASREADDTLERLTGGVASTRVANEGAWEQYRGRFVAEGLRVGDRDRVQGHDVDRYTLALAHSIRSRYGRELSLSTPFMNEYVDAACLVELSRMHAAMDEFGHAIDPEYSPSMEVETSAQRSVLSVGGVELQPDQVWRPTRDDIIVALQDGTFDELLDRVVMPEDELDELMSEAMDQYVEEHAGRDETTGQVIDFMDRAEQDLGRAVDWQDGPTRTKLREMQELRGQEILSAESTPDHLVAVPLDEAGFPELSQAMSPEAPVTVEEAREEPELVFEPGSGRTTEDEELIASLEHHHVLDEDEAEDVEAMFDSGDARRAREILEERAEQAQEAEEDAEAARAQREVESSLRDRFLLESALADESRKFTIKETHEEPDFA